jgi:hypothetical protein
MLAVCVAAGVWTLAARAAAQDLGAASRAAASPAPVAAPAVLERDSDGRVVIRAIPVTEPPVIDGTLDDAIYASVSPASGFVQQEPHEGQPASDKTEVWVLYDEQALYVAARCWQPADVKLVANEMRRDSFAIFQNDNFGVILDTFRDGRNGFMFYTNPIGGLADVYVTDERDSNRDWNTIWDTRTARFDGGWSVEMVIPFKSLRFPPGSEQTWGVNFRRIVRDRPEFSYLVPIPASAGPRGIMRVSLAPPLVGVTAPPPGLNLEVKPFGIVQTQIDKEATIPPDDFDADAGFDVKYGVTKSLTADFTYNTDFAQVEEDELQVNLTRFNLFFPEKREFFLEGQGIFSFGGVQNGPGGRQGPPSSTPVLFFSRRIGLNEDATVPIDVGGRLTGKAGPWSLGLLDVQTADSPEALAVATNFAVARVKRDILRRSAVGVIATNRSRTIESTGSNQVFGLDGNFAFYENVSIVGYFAKSWTTDRDGQDTSYRGQLDYSGDRYGFEVEHLLVDENFNPEIGFLRREAFRRSFAQARFSPRPKNIPWIRKWGLEPSFDYITNPGGDALESRQAQLTGRVEFANGDNFGVDYERNYEALDEPFEITDEVTIPTGAYRFDNVRVRYELGPQRRVSGGVTLNTGGFFDGTRQEVGWRGRVELSSQLSLEPTLSFNWVRLPYGDFDTQLVGARTTYTISPRMLASALLQYNSAAEIASANIRYRWEYRPGSDLFVVYSEGRDTEVPGSPTLSNRSFAVKLTRLFRF